MRRVLALALLATLAVTACADPADSPATDEGALETAAAPAQLRYTPRYVLDRVLEYKQRPFDPQKPMPEVRFASTTSLVEFQDAIEPQWGFRPSKITNAYVVTKNVIYLMDDAAYYAQHGRCIDDSLAHELTHYVQVKYQGWALDGADDSIELDAIGVQTSFREAHCRT